MGTFSYCPVCQEGLSAPTAREDMIDGLRCSNGHLQDRRYTTEEWIALLYENLEAHIEEGDK